MKKLFLLYTAFLLFQVNAFAQLELLNNKQQQKISSEQLIDALNANLDSLMLDSIFTEYITSENIPGATGLIVNKNGDIMWSGNYGYRNLELQLPVEDSTMFLVASISKTFVATAIMQLWENGLINLDGNINDYLPDGFTIVNPNFPNDTITVEMLMIHTSSLRDYPFLWQLSDCGDYPESVDSFLVNYFTPGGRYYSPNNFYAYPPGSTYNYSGFAVSLMALMVKHLSGKNFDDYIIDSIFTPLSMNSTSWFLQGMDTSKIAIPYKNHPPQATCHLGFAAWPQIQLRTNKLELAHFLSAYINGGIYNNNRILDSATVSLMLSDHLGHPLPWGGAQGLIWYTDPGLYNNIWGHEGGWVGCQTAMYFSPTEDWGVIFFINWAQPPTFSPGFYSVFIQMANYAHLLGNVYAMKPSIDKSYARKGIDSVLFNTRFSNIYNHTITPYLIYANLDSTQIDSLTIFDDGMHGDSLASDGLYGGCIPPRQIEDFFTLSVSIVDNQTNEYLITPDLCRFTTAGPVTLDSLFLNEGSNNFSVIPSLKNESTVSTITNASVKLICNDPWIISITPTSIDLPIIPPSATISPADSFLVTIDYSIFTGIFNFEVEVLSEGWTYWKDSMQTITGFKDKKALPSTYKLEQNYPNPFNPTTTIKYSVPEMSKVSVTIYNLLGEELAALVNEEKVAGYYTVEFNAAALPSGVYFYQLKAGDFMQTKKMILIK